MEGKDIIDIGCGTGWLLEKAVKGDAKSVLGIEPSIQNVTLAHRYYPNIPIVQSTLQGFTPLTDFDMAISVMSLNHIDYLEEAFKSIQSMLKEKGELLAIVPDYKYFRRPRYGYEIRTELLNEGDYAVSVKRPTGVIADIIRTLNKYKDAGNKAGMSLAESIPMPPTEMLMSKSPRYKEANGTPLTHLLRFTVNV